MKTAEARGMEVVSSAGWSASEIEELGLRRE